uniref:nitroreductase family protein n=1 Tax=Nocardioides pelophilus TaxID=2172019 RepID=UPI001601DDB2
MSHAPMPEAASLAEPLRSRWSPSVFDAEHRLTAEEITTLLHAAQWAPSSGNLQPWRFVVCERGDAAHRAMVPHLSRGNSGWVPRASVVFLTATQVAEAPD